MDLRVVERTLTMSDPMEAHPSKDGYGVPDPYGTPDGYDAPEDSYADNADYDVSAPNDDPYAYDQKDEDGDDYPEPGYDNVDGNGDGDDVGGDPDYVDYDDVGEQGEYSEDNNFDYAGYDEDGGDAGIPPEYTGHDNNGRDDDGKGEVYSEYRSYDSSQIDSSYNNGSDSKAAKPDPSQGVRNAPPQPGAGALPQSPNTPHAQRAPGRANPSSQASHPRAVPAPQNQNARGRPSTGRPNTSPRASHPRAGPPQNAPRAYENGRRLNASSRASHHAGSPHQSHNARAQPIVGRQNSPSSPLANPASAKLNPAHPLRNVPVNTTTTMHALPKTQHRPIQQLSVTAQSHAQQGFPQARPQTHNNQPHGPSNSHVYPPQPQTFGQRPPSQVQHPPSTHTAHQDHVSITNITSCFEITTLLNLTPSRKFMYLRRLVLVFPTRARAMVHRASRHSWPKPCRAHLPNKMIRILIPPYINKMPRLWMSMFRGPQRGTPVTKVTNRQLRQGWLRRRREEETETSRGYPISGDMAELGLMDCATSPIYVGIVSFVDHSPLKGPYLG